MRQKAQRLLGKGSADFDRFGSYYARKLQDQVVERMDMLQRQVFMALPSVTVVVVVRIPEVSAHESTERNRFSLFSSQALVQFVVLHDRREFAQLAKVCPGQETAEQKIERHKLSNDFHGAFGSMTAQSYHYFSITKMTKVTEQMVAEGVHLNAC